MNIKSVDNVDKSVDNLILLDLNLWSIFMNYDNPGTSETCE
ncbi:MAG: hypothetical protein AB1567_05870 [bacterium]